LPANVPALDDQRITGESKPFSPGPLRGIRILIVDDDDDARELISEVMIDAGAVVAKASTASEAYDLLRAEPPHILISDIGMPEEDGHSLLRRVRALPPEKGGDVPAIALTAYARPEDVRAAAESGFQLHVVKPVKPEALLEAISAWARR
jgi:CheY-like chemotaxis protein